MKIQIQISWVGQSTTHTRIFHSTKQQGRCFVTTVINHLLPIMYNIFTLKQAHSIYLMCKLATEKYFLLNHGLTFHMEVFTSNFVPRVAFLIEMKYIYIFCSWFSPRRQNQFQRSPPWWGNTDPPSASWQVTYSPIYHRGKKTFFNWWALLCWLKYSKSPCGLKLFCNYHIATLYFPVIWM